MRRSMLVDGVHDDFLRDLPRFARLAGIEARFISDEPLGRWVTEVEKNWVIRYRNHPKEGVFGIFWHGPTITPKGGPSVLDRMQAMAGALIRNFIDARVIALDSLCEQVMDSGLPDCDAIFIPDLYTGIQPTEYQKRVVTRLVMDRRREGRRTGMFIGDTNKFSGAYGGVLVGLISDWYASVTVE